MIRKCRVCDAEALPSDDMCARHMVESWAGISNQHGITMTAAIMRREAEASVALDHGEIGTHHLQCKHLDGARVTEIVDGHEITYCRMCYEGVA